MGAPQPRVYSDVEVPKEYGEGDWIEISGKAVSRLSSVSFTLTSFTEL